MSENDKKTESSEAPIDFNNTEEDIHEDINEEDDDGEDSDEDKNVAIKVTIDGTEQDVVIKSLPTLTASIIPAYIESISNESIDDGEYAVVLHPIVSADMDKTYFARFVKIIEDGKPETIINDFMEDIDVLEMLELCYDIDTDIRDISILNCLDGVKHQYGDVKVYNHPVAIIKYPSTDEGTNFQAIWKTAEGFVIPFLGQMLFKPLETRKEDNHCIKAGCMEEEGFGICSVKPMFAIDIAEAIADNSDSELELQF